MGGPTKDEVQAASAAIQERRSDLQRAYDEATGALRDRIAERQAVERHRAEILHALQMAHGEAADAGKELKHAEPAAVLQVINSANRG